ncbi:MAG TPA: glycosyltransferase family 1 protein [bacterium]|nr:glycosyltransferase family 1 protein [bacterium]
MKIALVRQSYHKYGGAERYVSYLAEELLKKGHEVHIFARKWDPNVPKEIIFHRVPTLRGPSFLKALSFAYNVKRLLEEEKFDIINSFDRTLYQDIYRAGDGVHRKWRKRLLEITPNPLTRLSILLNPLHLSLLSLEKRIFEEGKYKKIIAISKEGKEEIIKYYGVRPEDIMVVYNGVDLEEFHPQNKALFREEIRKEFNIGNDEFLILFVGSGFRRKGLRYLIEAVSLLKEERPLKMLVVAKGKKRPYLRLARRLGIKDKIIFTGGRKDLRKFYATSDLFVLPTIYEPFGNVCLETLASGLPIIVSKTSGAAEIITEGENGLLLKNPRDSQELAEKIRLTFDNRFRNKLAKNARTLAENFTVDKNVEKTLEVYRQAINNYNEQ